MSESCFEEIRNEDVHILLDQFSKIPYRVKADQRADPVTEKCLKLFAKDYQFSIIHNNGGELCAHYPNKIVLLEYEKNGESRERVESFYDKNKVRELFKQAGMARCRSRFVVPVIMYEGKHVCRSATLSGGVEMYGRSGLNFLFRGDMQKTPSSTNIQSDADQGDMQMFDSVRGQDIDVLKTFSIKYIVDLMVEKKKVKFGVNITSSEKVDKKNRYGEFCIASIPYPGCEFFKEWKDNSYLGEEMKYDWKQGFVDACLDIPPTELLNQMSIDWSQYQNWSLVKLTQNYLKMMLHILTKGDRGILVHCISGWDRTPIFVSLLRLSLWADGAIHKSLSAVEILYLTLAYDWYLFGHHLPDRLNKGEEILYFCFHFLSYIISEEYSVQSIRSSKSTASSTEPGLHKTSSQPDPDLGSRNHFNSGSSTGSVGWGRMRNTSSSSLSSVGSFIVEPYNSVFHLTTGESDTELTSQDFNCLPESSRPSPYSFVQGQSSNQGTSSPVQVPNTRGRQPQHNDDSPTCGSWQVITNTGSLVTGDALPNTRPSSCFNSCEEMSDDVTVPERWDKLDRVRRIFLNAYHNRITTKFRSEASASNLFDQFAEKVGFKSTKGFY